MLASIAEKMKLTFFNAEKEYLEVNLSDHITDGSKVCCILQVKWNSSIKT